MRQSVTVTRAADRHAEPHGRAFAETLKTDAPAGPLADVLAGALRGLDLPEGRYVVEVGWPHAPGFDWPAREHTRSWTTPEEFRAVEDAMARRAP